MNSQFLNRDLLKKVYDKYINEDYSLGLDNLNPKREISKVDASTIVEDDNAIMSAVLEALAKVKETLNNLPNYKNNTTINNNEYTADVSLFGNPVDMTDSQLNARLFAGSDPNGNIFFTPLNGTNPILKEIDNLLASIPNLDNVNFENQNDYDSSVADSSIKQYFDVDCSGYVYEVDNASNEDNESTSSENDESSTSSSDSSDDESSDTSEDVDNTKNSSDSLFEQQIELIDKANQDSEESESKLKECYTMQLKQLKAILIILKIVIRISNTTVKLMQITVPIVKIVALASQCWINPPAATEAIQIVSEKIYALLMSIISEILQTLWDALNLDCTVSEVQDLIDQVNSTISNINNNINISKKSMNFCINGFAETINAVASIKNAFSQETWEKAKENWNEELKNSKDELSKVWKNYFGKATDIKSIISANDKINNTVIDLYKDALATKTKAVNAYKNATSDAGLNKSLEKVANILDDFQTN